MNSNPIALELRNVTKSYGGVAALREGNLRIAKATIHGVVGANGAGKSTLIKIASGVVRRDGGSILVNGMETDLRSVPDALAAGIVAMPQELTIVPDQSVAENITMGREPSVLGFTTTRRSRVIARKLLREMGVSLDVARTAGEIEPAEQRIVMLARALHTGAHTLILDEPTAALNAAQAEVFLRVVSGLRESGYSVVYISHRFNEVEELCDEVTILRDGMTVDRLSKERCRQDELVAAVVQDSALSERVLREKPAQPNATPAIEMRNVSGRILSDISFSVRPGEILGFCGLAGSGVNEVMEFLGGVRSPVSGQLRAAGQEMRFDSPAEALKRGVTYLPVERAKAGMVDMSIRANLVTASLPQISRLGFVTQEMEDAFSNSVLSNLGLAHRAHEPLRALSGGNRQKVLLGRCLLADARVVVLDDPTVGVDVRARADIHELLGRFADQGRAVIVAVSEPEELLSVADRVLVMNRGTIVAELTGSEITSEALVRAATTSGKVGAFEVVATA
ncbi:sugar ABC transporter ATP-binding protein [Thioclava sp. F34-6]|uniref:sugar ABC transporter ATP-binding protein n=1 Tax=Thioclava sp. F34-6 TaxID=1973003 RepID=UPI00143A8039|nr:sugar ABC transporter ATP-binding protein [Thioclava sp. F34-6]